MFGNNFTNFGSVYTSVPRYAHVIVSVVYSDGSWNQLSFLTKCSKNLVSVRENRLRINTHKPLEI